MVARHLVRFERGSDERDAVHLAMAGICNKEIMRRTGLTDSQITYRLHKAKEQGQYDQGFRMSWRYGNSPLLDKFLSDVQGVMDLEIDRRVQIKIDHPTPLTVKSGQ